MNNYSKFGEIIRRHRRSKLWTLQYTCEMAGGALETGNLSRIERGEITPNFVAAYKVVKALGLNMDDIFSEIEGTAPKPAGFERKIPVLSWVKAGAMCSSPTAHSSYDCDEWISPPRDTISERAFALKVSGDSMQSLNGMSFPDGSYIVVDPSRHAENRSFVVALMRDTEESTFKQLIIDGGRKYLKPLNPQYPIINTTEDMIICGVVTDMVANIT